MSARTPRAGAVALLVLCACSPTIQLGAGEPAPPRFYELSAPREAARAGPALPGPRPVLELPRPLAPPSLDRTRIAVRPAPRELRYLADARWADRLGTLLHGVLVLGFERDGRVQPVREDFSGRSTARLRVEIREFHADLIESASPLAVVELHAQLLAFAGGEIAGARSFRRTAPIETSDPDAVVAAFDGALGSLIEDLVSWTVSELPEGDPAAPPALR